jgi:hypothetical protein
VFIFLFIYKFLTTLSVIESVDSQDDSGEYERVWNVAIVT